MSNVEKYNLSSSKPTIRYADKFKIKPAGAQLRSNATVSIQHSDRLSEKDQKETLTHVKTISETRNHDSNKSTFNITKKTLSRARSINQNVKKDLDDSLNQNKYTLSVKECLSKYEYLPQNTDRLGNSNSEARLYAPIISETHGFKMMLGTNLTTERRNPSYKAWIKSRIKNVMASPNRLTIL